MYDADFEKSFEKLPSGEGQQLNADKWANSMSNPPEFNGNQFGVANETNNYYGETTGADESSEEFDKGISDASSILNYGGLNAAAAKYGVENVVQRIKNLDVDKSDNPISDIYQSLGIETVEQKAEIDRGQEVLKSQEADFYEGPNKPSQNKSFEGLLASIKDMKELISEVEGADPRYEDLRQGAKTAGKGIFEYAVSSMGVQDLTGLFRVLSSQKEANGEELENPEKSEASENSETPESLENLDIQDNEISENNYVSDEDKIDQNKNPEILKEDVA